MSFKDQMSKQDKKDEQLKKIATKKKVESSTINENFEKIPSSLDEIEKEIFKLEINVREYGWEIGRRLNEIDKNFLKETNYTNVKDYAFDKFGFSHRTTTYLKFIANNFDKGHARALGSKLRLLSSVNDDKREEYLDWMMNEQPTYREIEDKVKKKNNKEPSKPKNYIVGSGSVTIHLSKMGLTIKKDKSEEFLNELKKLVERYSDKINEK